MRSEIPAKTVYVPSMGMLALLLSLSFLPLFAHANHTVADHPACTAGDIGGSIFRDYNANGLRDNLTTAAITGQAFTEPNFTSEELTLHAYDQSNAIVATTTTDEDGDFLFTGISPGEPYRIEMDRSSLPDWLEIGAAHAGGDSLSVVSTASASDCDLELSVNAPGDFCQDNPVLFSSCYLNGNTTYVDGLVNDPATVSFYYNAFEDDSDGSRAGIQTHPVETVQGEIGTVYGHAYNRRDNLLYASAYARNHVEFSPDGLGSIYTIDPTVTAGTAGNVNLLASLPAGTDPRPVGYNVAGDPNEWSTQNDWRADHETFYEVGKIGLGDMDITEDDSTLYVTNLFDKNLYEVDTVTGVFGVVAGGAVPVPAQPGCAGGADWSPMAVKVHDGKVYVGGVCTAETSQDASELYAAVYHYDIATDTWNTTADLGFPLDYPRDDFTALFAVAHWNSWTTDWGQDILASGNYEIGDDGKLGTSLPQPMFGDIEFDRGDMILTLKDRWGDQNAPNSIMPPTTATLPDDPVNGPAIGPPYEGSGLSGGDILRACVDSSDGDGDGSNSDWLLENGGTCGSITTTGGGMTLPDSGSAYASSDGPGGAEYYFEERFRRAHQETAQGGLYQFPGLDEVAAISMSPDVSNSGGIEWHNSQTGANNRTGYTIFTSGGGTASKANGLSDLEAACFAAPIEIGNRVWFDKNGNGIQDPWADMNGNGTYDVGEEEFGINGLTVNLYDKTDDSLVATAVTDHDGNYIFRSHNYDHEDDGNVTDYLGNPLVGPGSDDPDPITTDHIGIVPGGIELFGDYYVRIDDQAGVGGQAANTIQTIDGSLSLTIPAGGATTANDATVNGSTVVITLADSGQVTRGDQSDDRESDASLDTVSGLAGEGWVIDTYHTDNTSSGRDPEMLGNAGQNTNLFDFGFTNVGSIGDYVWLDANQDGVQDAGENPIPNVTVILTLPGGSTLTTTTDANGLYLFAGLPAGDYTITIDPTTLPDDVEATYDFDGTLDNESTYTLAEGEHNREQDFGYYAVELNFDLALRKVLVTEGPYAVNQSLTYTLTVFNQGDIAASDVVVLDTPPSGITLTSANPVTITDVIEPGESYDVVMTAVINPDASGTLANVAEIASARDANGNLVDDIDSTPDTDPNNDLQGEDNTTNNAQGDEDDSDIAELVLIGAGETTPDTFTGVIGNRVYVDENHNCEKDPNEETFENVEIELTWAGPDGEFDTDDDQTWITETDEDGYYEFTNLPPGKYVVDVDLGDNDLEGYTIHCDGKGDSGRANGIYQVSIDQGEVYKNADFGFVLENDDSGESLVKTGTNMPLYVLGSLIVAFIAGGRHFFKKRKSQA